MVDALRSGFDSVGSVWISEDTVRERYLDLEMVDALLWA